SRSQICASEDEGSYVPHSAAALGSGDNQQARKAVEDEGEDEKHQAKLDQGLRMELTGCFGEFIGDHGGDGISGREQRRADHRRIADNHGDGHRFAEGPSQGQKIEPKMPARAKGTTTFHVDSQRVAPRESAASRWSRGTERSTSRETEMI